jgi:hypothetical protein
MPSSFETFADGEFEALRTNGIKVNYWVVCQRKVWLYAKGLRMEPLSDRVALGRILHERAYPDLPRRGLFIDDLILVRHRPSILGVAMGATFHSHDRPPYGQCDWPATPLCNER